MLVYTSVTTSIQFYFVWNLKMKEIKSCQFSGAKTGKDNGFSVLFDIESYDYGYYDEGSEGLKVAIVHHLDMPIIRQRAFHVAPGTENQIPVTPTLYTTAPQVNWQTIIIFIIFVSNLVYSKEILKKVSIFQNMIN